MKMIRLFLLMALTGFSGCFSLAREEPTRQHFVLGGHDMPGGVEQTEQLSGLRIGLRQLQIAEYLDSPLIVVRQGEHQVRYSEFNRWGGSLSNGVEHTLETYLIALASFDGVDTVPWDPRVTHDYLIQVHLLRMEGLVPEDQGGAEGEARMLASWEIINPQDGAILARGTTDHETSGWTVGDYDGLVDRLDAGLWNLSRDLVAAIATLGASNRPD